MALRAHACCTSLASTPGAGPSLYRLQCCSVQPLVTCESAGTQLPPERVLVTRRSANGSGLLWAQHGRDRREWRPLGHCAGLHVATVLLGEAPALPPLQGSLNCLPPTEPEAAKGEQMPPHHPRKIHGGTTHSRIRGFVSAPWRLSVKCPRQPAGLEENVVTPCPAPQSALQTQP